MKVNEKKLSKCQFHFPRLLVACPMLKKCWITIKSQHFHPKKSDLGPVHLDQISDKLDYLSCPSGQKNFFDFFSFGQATSSLGKWNWHLLKFFSFTFILAQCVLVHTTNITYQLRFDPSICKTHHRHTGQDTISQSNRQSVPLR